MVGTVFTTKAMERANKPKPLYKVKARHNEWLVNKRSKARKQLVKHKAECLEWRKEHSRGRPRLKMMYQIGIECSQAKTSVKQPDWRNDLIQANKSGEHKTPEYTPNIRFSQTYFGSHTAYQSTMWKQEVDNMCRGRK
jgi:hypothetical protein